MLSRNPTAAMRMEYKGKTCRLYHTFRSKGNDFPVIEIVVLEWDVEARDSNVWIWSVPLELVILIEPTKVKKKVSSILLLINK